MKPLFFRSALAFALMLSGCDGTESPGQIPQQKPPLSPRSAMKATTAKPPVAEPDPLDIASLKPARPAGGIRVRPGRFIEWSFEGRSHPTRYRMGDMEVVVKAVRDPDWPEDILDQVTVLAPGRPPLAVPGRRVNSYQPLRMAWGRLDREGTPFVMLASNDMRGPHCCQILRAVVAYPAGLRIVELGERDGGFPVEFPRDHDGDGRPDILLKDDAFLYAFATYAESWSPPVVKNIIDGKAVDVSRHQRFRELFVRDMNRARRSCLYAKDGTPDGVCAGYAASAARAGKFAKAWREIVRRRGPESDWKLPPICNESRMLLGCPKAYQDGANDYLTALRGELKRLGYISG